MFLYWKIRESRRLFPCKFIIKNLKKIVLLTMFVTVAFCRCSRSSSSAELLNKYSRWTVRRDTYDNYQTFPNSINNINASYSIFTS